MTPPFRIDVDKDRFYAALQALPDLDGVGAAGALCDARCNCASTPPTMPTCRALTDHLPSCPAASLPVEPAGTPTETLAALEALAKAAHVEAPEWWDEHEFSDDGFPPAVCAYLAACSPDRIALVADTLTTGCAEILLAANRELAALTSEVSRLQKNWDEAYEVHESDKIEIIDLRAEVSALREAVDSALSYVDRAALRAAHYGEQDEEACRVADKLRAARRDGAP